MSDRPCILCNHAIDDALQFGEKTTYEGTTVHYYCCLSTSNLVQNGEDDEGISGFMPKDIKYEVSRTKKLLCYYCNGKSATIGWCVKSCPRSFHLPCGLQHDCQFEFSGTFRSFCEEHRQIKKPKYIHQPTDLCTVCYDEMGTYNLIQSIPLPCCNENTWCHKLCLQKYAQTSGYFLTCPLCKDADKFREFIAQRGVFIPDRDAKWENETGPNTFYDFEQHNEKPSECIATVCKCSKGRSHHVDFEDHRYSFEYCEFCGSHAAHLGCIDGKTFRCNECTTVVSRMAETPVVSESDRALVRTESSHTSTATSSNSNSRRSRGNARRNSQNRNVGGANSSLSRAMKKKYKISDCSVRSIRLKPKDIIRILNDIKCDAAESKGKPSAHIAGGGSNDGKKEIHPVIRTNQKFATIFESKNENDIEVGRAEMAEEKITISDSESELDYKRGKMDCNDNSKNMQTSNQPSGTPELINPFAYLMKPKSNSSHDRQFSSSKDEKMFPKRVLVHPSTLVKHTLWSTDSSDEQIVGKENEKPARTVAVVRPFSKPETPSDERVEVKTNQNCSIVLSSDEGEYTYKSSITQRFDYLKNAKKSEDENKKQNDGPLKKPDLMIKTEPATPTSIKRKHHTVRSYFCDISSSDDETVEKKPKRKSPKKPRKSSAASSVRPPNQATNVSFFKKQPE